MTEKKLKRGDRVRVTYETKYEGHGGKYAPWHQVRGLGYIPHDATIEVIEPADDPSEDPVGTVRRRALGLYAGLVAVKLHAGYAPWYYVPADPDPEEDPPLTDGFVTGWEIIGAVPGTPAWDQQQSQWSTKLYTAEEVGDLQASEATLVTEPLLRRIEALQTQAATDPPRSPLCDRHDCPGGRRCSSGAIVVHDRTAACDEPLPDGDPYPRYWRGKHLYRVASPGSDLEQRSRDGKWSQYFSFTEASIGEFLSSHGKVTRYYPWTGDGSEEPPEHVQKVRDRQGFTLTRVDGGWGDSQTGQTDPWYWTYERQGPYTEVID